jgi:hypothetical protein
VQKSQEPQNFGIDKFYLFYRLSMKEEAAMANIQHLGGTQTAPRAAAPRNGTLASLAAHAVFIAAVAFAAALVLGLIP